MRPRQAPRGASGRAPGPAARPTVALLYAGSTTTTIGNPIQDVISALNISFVGGATHSVSCSASAAQTSGGGARGLSTQALERAAAVKNVHAAGLLSRRGVQGVGVGVGSTDADQPAIVIYVIAGVDRAPLPDSIDGVPTQTVTTDRFRAFGWNETFEASCSR